MNKMVIGGVSNQVFVASISVASSTFTRCCSVFL
jgi:hypothetical protein